MEAEEIEGRITALWNEKAEITTAIAKLRGAIGHLNREGRERLEKVFAQIDGHMAMQRANDSVKSECKLPLL